MTPKKVKLFRWELSVNSLWLWWYCVLCLAGEGYLLYRAIKRCKEYNELPWNSEEKPITELYIYIVLIVISVMTVPFLVLTSLFKFGNYANDGTRLGRDNIAKRIDKLEMKGQGHRDQRGQADDGKESDDLESGLEATKDGISLWRQLGPFCHSFHILAAFTLLLPDMLLEAQEIKHGFVSPGEWKKIL